MMREAMENVRAELPKRLFTVDEYYRMAEVGILDPDARLELLEGEIVDRSLSHVPRVSPGRADFSACLPGRLLRR
jgi:hypothetical protein